MKFPIDVGISRKHEFIKRLPVNNVVQLDYVINKYSSCNIFASIFSKKQQAMHMYDTMVLDIDSDDIDEAIYYADVALSKIRSADPSVSVRVYFSGCKGFHIKIDFQPVVLNDYRRSTIELLKFLKIDSLVDKQVLQPNALLRVPNTKHAETGLYCVPIKSLSRKEVLESALCKSTWDFIVKPSRQIGLLLQQFDVSSSKNKDADNASKVVASSAVPPCVYEVFKKIIYDLDVSHTERLFAAMYGLNIGLLISSLQSIFKVRSDYVERVTLYQLNYIYNRKLRVFSCRNLLNMGLCPLKSRCIFCDFYPSINRYLSNPAEAGSFESAAEEINDIEVDKNG